MQVQHLSESGRRTVAKYRLGDSPMPVIMVVEPETGALFRHFTGFVQHERLMEELVRAEEIPFFPCPTYNPTPPRGLPGWLEANIIKVSRDASFFYSAALCDCFV